MHTNITLSYYLDSFPLSESEKMVEEAEFKHMLKQMNEREKSERILPWQP